MYASPSCGCHSRRAFLGRYNADVDDLGDEPYSPEGGAGGTGSGAGGGGGYAPTSGGGYVPPDATPPADWVEPYTGPVISDPVPLGPGDPIPTLPPMGPGEGDPGPSPAPPEVGADVLPGAGSEMLEWILSALLAAALVSRR